MLGRLSTHFCLCTLSHVLLILQLQRYGMAAWACIHLLENNIHQKYQFSIRMLLCRQNKHPEPNLHFAEAILPRNWVAEVQLAASVLCRPKLLLTCTPY